MAWRTRGFTLIELMIVVSILGVITALALPTYGKYVARTQATRVVSELAHLRARVEECVSLGLTVQGTDGGQCDMSTFSTDLASGLMTGLQVGDTRISAQLGVNAAASIRGYEVSWQRTSNGAWICYSDLEQGFRPDLCRYDG